MSNKKTEGFKNWLKTSVWVFPVALFLLLLFLTAFKISGTSVGVYHQALYGAETKDPNLIYGHPRLIRSDEWLTASQFLVSQSQNNFPRFNADLPSGQDVSLQPDMPMRDWPTLFKPQNWAFFVVPLENAFAFRWWLLMYLLIVSCYFFTLRILPRSKFFAILFSIAIAISPFELWWYQTGAFLSIAYAFMMMLLATRIIDREKVGFIRRTWLSDILQVGALAFIVACFGLILYPPFQIPCAVVVLFYVLGLLLKRYFVKKGGRKLLLLSVFYLLMAVLTAAIVGILFITSRHNIVSALNHSLYPGQRTIFSGGLSPIKVFDGFMQAQLQSDLHGNHFMANQSEDSNFILFMPFLIIPGAALVAYEYKSRKKIDWLLLASLVVGALFLARVFIHFGDPFYKLFLLQKVPHERLIIGMGLVGILQVLFIIKKISELKIPKKTLLSAATIYSLIAMGFTLYIGRYTLHHYPLFINNKAEVVSLALLFTVILWLFLSNYKFLAVSALLLFTVGSSFRVIPLYRGLGFDAHSAVADEMTKISGPNDTWGTVDIPLFQNMGILAGSHSITGTQLYPNLGYWTSAFGSQYNYVFNREAHAVLTEDPSLNQPVRLVQRNFYDIKLDCNSRFLQRNLNFALSIKPLTESCTKLVKTINYPQLTIYLYKMSYKS